MAPAEVSDHPPSVRYKILLMLFAATALNYADRAILSVAAPTLQADLGLAPVMMGYVF